MSTDFSLKMKKMVVAASLVVLLAFCVHASPNASRSAKPILVQGNQGSPLNSTNLNLNAQQGPPVTGLPAGSSSDPNSSTTAKSAETDNGDCVPWWLFFVILFAILLLLLLLAGAALAAFLMKRKKAAVTPVPTVKEAPKSQIGTVVDPNEVVVIRPTAAPAT